MKCNFNLLCCVLDVIGLLDTSRIHSVHGVGIMPCVGSVVLSLSVLPIPARVVRVRDMTKRL